MQILLYQPDIAGNVGTIIRMCACFNLELNIIEPCGFPFDENKIKRAALDYFDYVKINKFDNFKTFQEQHPNNRIILLSTKASTPYHTFNFQSNDILMVGRETAGVPEEIHKSVNHRVLIPMKNNMRCLNVAISLAIVTGEALKQTNLY